MRYALDFNIDPSKKTFVGRARIAVTIEKPTRAIVMHGRTMQLTRATLHGARGDLSAKPALRRAARSKEEPEELVLAFDRELEPGEGELDLAYEAPFAQGLRGLYNVEEGGAFYAYTQFEPNDARRAFPCFDEPNFKTPFELTITVPKGSIAVSNAKEARRREDPKGQFVTFEFDKSPPLPTYLVALAVGPFEILEGPKAPVPVRLVATQAKASLGKLAVDASAAHLELLGKYFDRPYPYSKLDVVAVPNFAAGAMENAGLVTFREELLLLHPEHASTVARRAEGHVIAHELAHQWFGDLVTMQWWDDLWLNEAFASWMSDKIIDQWKPATQARLESVGDRAWVMAQDSLVTARKIRNPVRSTSDAVEAFDGITYNKGRAVLAMVESWLGEDAFRDGLRRYMEKHAWANATAGDLYAALGEASGRDVARVMDTFTDQTGVPLLSARLECGATAQPASIRLHQREYRTIDRTSASGEKLWRIPVCVLYEAGGKLERQCTLLDAADGRIDLVTAKGRCPAFFYPNAGEAGYYRAKLERADLDKLLAKALPKLPDRERFGIASNAWAEVWSGDLPTAAYLQTLRSFRRETSRLVWGQILDSLQSADRAVVSDAARPAFAKLVRDVVGPIGRRLGFAVKKGEPEDDKLLRIAVLDTLGRIGRDDWALGQAARVAEAWLSDPMKIDADLARAAVPLAAKEGDAALFDRLVGVLKSPKTPEMRVLALMALAGFEDPKLVERTLGLTLDGSVKMQDIRYVFPPLANRRSTRDVTYAWIERHWGELTKTFPPFVIGRLAQVAGAMCDGARVRAVETFLRPRVEKIEGTEKNLNQAVEEGLRCAALAEKERAPTEKWLYASK